MLPHRQCDSLEVIVWYFPVVFLPVTLIIYLIMPAKARGAVLLIASLAFYFCGEQIYLLLMIGEIIVSYTAALLISKSKKPARRVLLILFLIISLGMLGLFKYSGLFSDSLSLLTGNKLIAGLNIHMPIGTLLTFIGRNTGQNETFFVQQHIYRFFLSLSQDR